MTLSTTFMAWLSSFNQTPAIASFKCIAFAHVEIDDETFFPSCPNVVWPAIKLIKPVMIRIATLPEALSFSSNMSEGSAALPFFVFFRVLATMSAVIMLGGPSTRGSVDR